MEMVGAYEGSLISIYLCVFWGRCWLQFGSHVVCSSQKLWGAKVAEDHWFHTRQFVHREALGAICILVQLGD